MVEGWKERALKLYKKGMNDKEIAIRCGVTSRTIYAWRKRKGYPAFNAKKPDDIQNPCAICQKNIADCTWLHEHKPILGWDAVLLVKKLSPGRNYMTWAIKECPLFIPPQEGRELD